eukprot:9498033-Pyramimonas_sp.AAC.1
MNPTSFRTPLEMRAHIARVSLLQPIVIDASVSGVQPRRKTCSRPDRSSQKDLLRNRMKDYSG